MFKRHRKRLLFAFLSLASFWVSAAPLLAQTPPGGAGTTAAGQCPAGFLSKIGGRAVGILVSFGYAEASAQICGIIDLIVLIIILLLIGGVAYAAYEIITSRQISMVGWVVVATLIILGLVSIIEVVFL